MNDSDLPGLPDPGTPEPSPSPSISEPAAPVPVVPVEPAPSAAPIDGPPPARDATRRQNRIAVVGTVALVVALAFGGGFVAGRATAPAGGTDGGSATGLGATPAPAATTADPSAPVPTPGASTGPALPSEGNRLGKVDAKVVIDYWSDFQCPFCRKFAEETIPLLTPYIEDGTVALVHRDYAFIGPESTDASIAVRCAGREGKYWPMHDAVYAAQNGENEGAFARERLVAIGESIGLDAATLEACMNDRSVLVEVLADTAAGTRVGIQSTPSIDVNGTRFTGVPKIADLTAAIDAAVAGATPAPLPTQQPLSDPWAGTPTDGRTAGDAAAPVTVALWTDYQAANSGTVAQGLDAELRARAAAGKVRLELHDLALLGDESVTAAAGLRCVDAQGGPTWFIHEILSASARGAGSGIYTPDNLLRLAAQLGLDVTAFDACVSDPAVAQAVRDETAEGQAAGLTEGPAIVVSAGGSEVARFSGAIDAAKALATIDAAAK